MRENISKRKIRHNRVRSKIFGTIERPRLSVFKSNKYFRVQIIDDENGVTLVSSSTEKSKESMLNQAKSIGKDIAVKAKAKGIASVSFDRGGYLYAGRVKALADSARENGLDF